MKINIYGVGRSGTKALQLYLAYMFAKEEGSARINYEPYNYYTRTGPLNFHGIYHHYNSALFADNADQLNPAHRKFIQSLAKNDNITTITKFVHATGRIGAISEIMKPDLNIVVVRDLYPVLSSLARMNWDFLSFGYKLLRKSYVSIWDNLVREIEQKNIVADFGSIKNKINDKITMNALYWYAMNMSALNHQDEKTIFINYRDLHLLPGMLAQKGIKIDSGVQISDAMFKGTNVHKNYPLKDIKRFKYAKTASKLKSNINQYNYLLRGSSKKPLFDFPSGTIVGINQVVDNTGVSEEDFHIEVKIKPNPLMDHFDQTVMELLAKKQ